jgi:hypothetical protein
MREGADARSGARTGSFPIIAGASGPSEDAGDGTRVVPCAAVTVMGITAREAMDFSVFRQFRLHFYSVNGSFAGRGVRFGRVG